MKIIIFTSSTTSLNELTYFKNTLYGSVQLYNVDSEWPKIDLTLPVIVIHKNQCKNFFKSNYVRFIIILHN